MEIKPSETSKSSALKLMLSNIHMAQKRIEMTSKLLQVSSGLQIEPRSARIDVDWSQPDLALR